MRPLAWTKLAAFALISALLGSPAAAQTPESPSTPPAPLTVPQTQPPPAPPLPPGFIASGLTWIEQPEAREFALYYPQQAMIENVHGRVILDCLIDADGRLGCTVVSEEPPGYGFGEATLAISRSFRVAPQTTDGRPTAGGRIRRAIRWVTAG